MAHYYAFCQKHKKIGNNYSRRRDAEAEARAHVFTQGPHGKIYVKLSNMRIADDGTRKYSYKALPVRDLE